MTAHKSITLTKTISIRDPWGETHVAQVTWMPEPMHGLNHALDNFGRTPVAWGDEDHCPVYWELDLANSCARLRERAVQFTGDIKMIARASEVESIAALKPGTYHVSIRSDEDE